MTVLNWRNDPLLFDSDCLPANEWMTANRLISSSEQEKIFLNEDEQILDLYPILVKKIDFVRENKSDRILSRFPFKVLTEEERNLINEKDLLIAEIARDYFYKSINNGILDWRIGIKHYLERGAMPYPLVRCAWEIIKQNELVNDAKIEFESPKGKKYCVSTKITKQIAYLCGAINGDGHLHKHWLRIVDETKEQIQLITNLFQKVFCDPGIIFKTGNAWNVELRSSAAVRLFNFLTDHTIQGAKYDSLREPLYLQLFDKSFRALYWRGAMDADGTYKNQIVFTSASKQFVKDFQNYLIPNLIDSKLVETTIHAYQLIIPAEHTQDVAKLIGVSNPKKRSDFYQLLQRKRFSNQFMGLRKETITTHGYFNFLLLDGLLVVGIEELLKEFRGERTYSEMSDLLKLSRGVYSKFEKQERAIPIKFLNKIITMKYKHSTSLMEQLENNYSKIYFKYSTSKAIKLPLKPSKELDQLLPLLDPRKNYLNVCLDQKKVINMFHNQFNVLLKKQRLDGRLIANFLTTFYNYNLTNLQMKKDELLYMKKTWDKDLG
ncbi:MAG: hypothetical protein HZR80_05905 [Candidatus Heimdallarchaeota archaeon]